MSNYLIVLLMILAVAPAYKQVAAQRRQPRCPNPPTEGWPIPTNCSFGTVNDVCGKPSCAMGPGDLCKYKRFQSSNCGEGTFCHCSRCMGCSLYSYTCFETTCVFAMSSRR